MYLTEQFDKTPMTIRLVVLLFKRTLVKLFQAESANEMFRMEFAMHGSNTTTCDWFLTTVTQGSSPSVVMHLTVWHTFMLKETSILKWLMTLLENEYGGNSLTYFFQLDKHFITSNLSTAIFIRILSF